MLVGKNSCEESHREFQSQAEIQEIYNSFIKKNMQTFYAYDFKENKHIPIESFKPDIVFYSRQFFLDEIYNINKISEFALTCYVPYFIPNSPINIEAGYLLNTKNPKHKPARIKNGGIIVRGPNK